MAVTPIKTFTKDPDAVLDYVIDWSVWPLADGEIITASTWTAPAGITVDSEDNDNTTTTVWLSGGTDGTKYLLTNHVTTSEGREDDRTIRITVRER